MVAGADNTREVLIRLKLEHDRQALSAAQKATKEAGKGLEDAAGQAERAVKKASAEQAKAIQRAAAEYRKHQDVITAANVQLGQSFKLGLRGAVTFARGLAIAFASNEEEAQKMTKALVKIFAAFEMVKGGIEIITALKTGMEAYKTATEGAAAAQTALAIAQGASAKTAGVSTGANVAAGAGAGGLAGTTGAGITGGLLGIAGPAAALIAGMAALTAAIWMWVEIAQGKAGPGTAQNWIGEKLADLASWEMKMTGTAGFFAGLPKWAPVQSIGEMALAEDKTGKKEADRTKRQELLGLQERMRSSELAEQLRLEGIERNKLESAKQKASVALAGAKAELQTAQQEYDIRKKIITQAREQLLSAKERFGALSPEQQQRDIQIMQKHRRGERLTVEEAGRMRMMGTASTAAAARQWDIQRTEEATRHAGGFAALFGTEETGIISREQPLQKKLEMEIGTRRFEVKVKVSDEARLVAALNAAMKKAFDESNERARKRHEREMNEPWVERFGNLLLGFAWSLVGNYLRKLESQCRQELAAEWTLPRQCGQRCPV